MVTIDNLELNVHVGAGVNVWVVVDVALCVGVVARVATSSDFGEEMVGVGLDVGVNAVKLVECDVVVVVGVDVFDASGVGVNVTVILDVDVAASAVFGVDVGVGNGVIGD